MNVSGEVEFDEPPYKAKKFLFILVYRKNMRPFCLTGHNNGHHCFLGCYVLENDYYKNNFYFHFWKQHFIIFIDHLFMKILYKRMYVR